MYLSTVKKRCQIYPIYSRNSGDRYWTAESCRWVDSESTRTRVHSEAQALSSWNLVALTCTAYCTFCTCGQMEHYKMQKWTAQQLLAKTTRSRTLVIRYPRCIHNWVQRFRPEKDHGIGVWGIREWYHNWNDPIRKWTWVAASSFLLTGFRLNVLIHGTIFSHL